MAGSCSLAAPSWPQSSSGKDTKGWERSSVWSRAGQGSREPFSFKRVIAMSKVLEGKHTALDVERIRKDFPILERQVHGKPLVYLDSSNTSQKPRQVIDRITAFYERHNANLYRGVYSLSEEATAMFEAARAQLAGFIGAP